MRPPPPLPIRRGAAPPPAARHEHTDLLRAVATALAAGAVHEHALAHALAALGDIELPPGASEVGDRVQLQAAAPLYFAGELEVAGILPTAELVAGLFASGALSQPLGPAAQLLNAFWRHRRERLDANERNAIFARVIEEPHFERLMGALCEAIVAQADGSDLREAVLLQTAAAGLAEFLAQRVDAMAAIAARDIVENIDTALAFLRDRLVQTAFGVTSLWALLAIAGAAQRRGDASVRSHADRGRAGQTVLLWLAAHGGDPAPQIDPANPADAELAAAAQRWLSARPATGAAPRPIAAAYPVAA